MLKLLPVFLALALCFCVTESFLVPSTVGRNPAEKYHRNDGLFLARGNNGEFSVVEDDDDDDEQDVFFEKADAASFSQQQSSVVEYAALLSPAGSSTTTASTLQIQVGDLALARKAWKKRRRSGSPLLVPCSVLSMDRPSMLRWNLVYLLYKFGIAQKDGVVMSLTDLERRHQSHLKGLLMSHASALGYETPRELVEALFKGKGTQDIHGVQLVVVAEDDDNDEELYLKSPLSKYRALKKASQAILLQVAAAVSEDTVEEEETEVKHTGYIRCRADPEEGNRRRNYIYLPLSAALRVSQKEDGKLEQGSIHPAVVFDFDALGDAGSPLLTLSLNPARRSQKSSSRAKSQKSSKYTPMRNPRHMMKDLHVGDGPYDARVVRLAKDHALVDFGVGRLFSSQQQRQHDDIGAPEYVKVFGTLWFKDAIDPNYWESNHLEQSTADDNDEEEEEEGDVFASMEEMLKKVESLEEVEGEEMEDITHMFSMESDGSLSYNNPETGESEFLSAIDEDDDKKDDEDDEEEDHPVSFDISSLQRPPTQRRARTIRLRVGDRLPVHILSVSKQSNQFTVTTDPAAVRGKKAKDIKKESAVSKKLEKLSQLLGGLDKAEELKGREYDGIVKATSQTGDWLYVQPNNTEDDNGGIRLPVGVAVVPEELLAAEYASGDLVRIQLDGIDASRGQLAMRVIEKLSP